MMTSFFDLSTPGIFNSSVTIVCSNYFQYIILSVILFTML